MSPPVRDRMTVSVALVEFRRLWLPEWRQRADADAGPIHGSMMLDGVPASGGLTIRTGER